jgi:hypothetical protein
MFDYNSSSIKNMMLRFCADSALYYERLHFLKELLRNQRILHNLAFLHKPLQYLTITAVLILVIFVFR